MATRYIAAIGLTMFLICNLAFAQTGYFGNYYTHQCRDTSQYGNYTWLYNPAFNGDSNAIIIITPNALISGLDEKFHCGLWYNKNISRWTIFSEQGGGDTMPVFSGFNILQPTANGTTIKHKATALNITGNKTLIDNPATNGKPEALLFISHNWGVSGGVYNNHATGVYYDQAASKWGILNEDLTSFPVNAVYNVFVVETQNPNTAFIHTTGTPSPSARHISYFDYAATEDGGAKIFVTHNLSPNGIANNKYDTSTVGVALKSTNWLIYNRSRNAMDSGSTFNILVANNVPTAIEQPEAAMPAILLYPNPSTGYLTIAHSYNFVTRAEITNAMGQRVARFDLLQKNTTVDISQLAAGIYQLSITGERGERLTTRRLVKN